MTAAPAGASGTAEEAFCRLWWRWNLKDVFLAGPFHTWHEFKRTRCNEFVFLKDSAVPLGRQ